jgi:hypothetical protein
MGRGCPSRGLKTRDLLFMNALLLGFHTRKSRVLTRSGCSLADIDRSVVMLVQSTCLLLKNTVFLPA